MSSISNKFNVDVNHLDLDRDGTNDRITFQVTQTGEQEFKVNTYVDTSRDGWGNLNANRSQTFAIDTTPGWQLSGLKFEDHRLNLLGKNGNSHSIKIEKLGVVDSNNPIATAHLDTAIGETAGILDALREGSELHGVFGGPIPTTKVDEGIGGLIGAQHRPTGSGGLGSRGIMLGDDTTATGLGGLDTKPRGSGSAGYGTGGSSFGEKSTGGIGNIGDEPTDQ